MSAGKLGLGTAAAIVVANMIGTGIFGSSGFQAHDLHDGPTMLVAWLVGGLLALAGATAYGELGAMMPRAGGEYVYLRQAYHPAVGAMSGWVSLFAGFSAPIATAALLFGKYVGVVWPALAGETAAQLVGVGLILAMMSLHAFDTVIGGRVQAAFTLGKVLLIAGFIGAGLLFGEGDWEQLSPRHGGLENVLSERFAMSLYWVMVAYAGWNAAAYIASDLEQPQKTLPRSLLLGTVVVMVLYLLLNVTFLYAMSPEMLAGRDDGSGPIAEVGAATAGALFGAKVGDTIAAVIALALVSSVSAMVMAGPRVYASMAEDGALPGVLAKRTSRGVPANAVFTQGVLACAFVLVGDLKSLVNYIGFTLSIFAALAVAAVIVLRVKRPDAPRPYRASLYPIAPILFVAVSAWAAYVQIRWNPMNALYGGVTIAAGLVVYLLTPARPRAVAD
ncbi:MAG: amino acid permease [Deltaproteobacteria bacterium]|nr:amino acid permease [Kofleriaceae bacterium]